MNKLAKTAAIKQFTMFQLRALVTNRVRIILAKHLNYFRADISLF